VLQMAEQGHEMFGARRPQRRSVSRASPERMAGCISRNVEYLKSIGFIPVKNIERVSHVMMIM
jgi:hypothetical protein